MILHLFVGQVMGQTVRHTDLAEKWLDKVQKASHTTPTIELLESVLRDAEQFLWAGHEMDSVGSSYRLLVSLIACICQVVGHHHCLAKLSKVIDTHLIYCCKLASHCVDSSNSISSVEY